MQGAERDNMWGKHLRAREKGGLRERQTDRNLAGLWGRRASMKPLEK